MPLASPLSISSQTAVTIPALVAGRTERRERKWTSSDLAFLRRGGGFESIGTDLLPHLLRQWRTPIGTPNPQSFEFCNRLQQFVNGLQQFRQSTGICNSLQHIATTADSEGGPQTAKDPVVEHKGWDASFDFFLVFWLMPLRFGRYSFRWTCIPLGMRLRFCEFRRPKPPPPPPYNLRGVSAWRNEQSD